MDFVWERRSRNYFAFILVFAFALILFGIFLGWLYGREAKHVMLEREQAIVCALFARDVPADVVADALRNETVTEEGVIFLRKTGRTDETNIWWLPVVQKSTASFLWVVFTGAGLLSVILAAVSAGFLEEREKVYQNAILTVSGFAEGSFDKQLQKNETGTLYQLFAAVDALAMALQSKVLAEQKDREFLKNTISDISHQLKTPVAALNMYVEIMRDEPDKPELVREFSGKSMQSLERMGRLIQMLLKMTRIDAGSIVFEKRDAPVREIAARAAGDLQARAQAEKKRIVMEGDEKAVLCCDWEWTQEALSNLIKNGLDHTKEGGIVRIGWESTPLMLKLSVADNGSGIAPEDIHHIFKRFYRSKRALDRRGVGLGLPLAKAVFEGQGGMLSVTSAEGEGSVFEVLFLTNP